MQKVNLYCLPFAGGSRYSYRKYEESAPDFLQLIPLEYPGRGNRTREPFAGNIDEIVEDLYRQIKDSIDTHAYAIYGHSMGGLLTSLLTRRIIAAGQHPPRHLFITGTSGPAATSRGQKKRHLLGKAAFIEELRSLKGSPDEVLHNPELLEYMEPILRSDFRITENYIYTEDERLDIPMTVITGTEEEMQPDEIHLWQKETSNKVEFLRMPGHHFFIYKYPFEIIRIISRKLVAYTKNIYQ